MATITQGDLSLTVNIQSTGQTTAQVTGKWVGASGSAGARYLVISLDGDQWCYITNTEGGGASNICTFDDEISGLDAGTTYEWSAVLAWGTPGSGTNFGLNVLPAWTLTGTFTTKAAVTIAPWSWEHSNGKATDTETQNVYDVLHGNLPIDYFFASVWNDIVDKTYACRKARGLDWSNYTATLANTYVKPGDKLTTARYRSLWYNIQVMEGTGLKEISSVDRLYGKHIEYLTDTLNTIIENL